MADHVKSGPLAARNGLRPVAAVALAALVALVALNVIETPRPAGADEVVDDRASLTFVHGVPDERFDVYVGKRVVAVNATFGSLHPGIYLDPGRHKISLRYTGAPARSAPIAKVRVNAAANATLTVVAHLDSEGEIDLYKRKVNTKWVNGEARLMVRHLAQAPRIQLRYDNGLKYRSIGSGQSRRSTVPALPFELAVFAHQSDGLQPILDPVTVRLAKNTVTVVYVVGSDEDGTLQTMSHAYRTTR